MAWERSRSFDCGACGKAASAFAQDDTVYEFGELRSQGSCVVSDMIAGVSLLAPKTSGALPIWSGERGSGGETGGVGCELDHFGIAVRSIASARSFYESLGIDVGTVESVPAEGVLVAIFSFGGSRLELLEPLTPDSIIGRFLERRGEGLHHIAINVPDVQARRDELASRGTRLIGDSIGIGAGGHAYFFVHPSSAGGVLVEIVGDAPAQTLKDAL